MQYVWLVAWHMGALHPVEKALTFVLAFGPFVFLALVIWWRKRHEDDDEDDGTMAAASADHPARRGLGPRGDVD